MNLNRTIATAPSVIYECILKTGDEVTVDNPANMPDRDRIETIYEPFVRDYDGT